ncbi:MAG: MBL fold metallo-hydrolase, partial [Acidimicrobiales bacterium]
FEDWSTASTGGLLTAVQSYVIDEGGRRVIVDTCIGNSKARSVPEWNMRDSTFLAEMTNAGYPPESIDFVICTHLHVDHVGWNTTWGSDGWVPTFRNARYIVAGSEWEHWDRLPASEFGDIISDSVRPVIDAGLFDFVSEDFRLDECVRLRPSPGHTPGHVSVMISSGSDRGLITGDVMHHPIQCAFPQWNHHLDFDRAASVETRIQMLTEVADDSTTVFPTHFPGSGAGNVDRQDGAWLYKQI